MRTKIEPKRDDEAGELPLHLKYRPASFKAMVGQAETVKSLQALMDKPNVPHAFLFVGDSGCGKTTLARIISKQLGVDAANITEIDAATSGGIDAMKEVMAPLRYKGFGNSPRKVIILDECHALTKPAWTSLLKTVEEPPEHVFFFFCTTDPGKVPENIRTRVTSYTLKPVRYEDMMDLLDMVVEMEGMKPAKGVLELVASESKGSPRLALVNLAKVCDCADKEEAAVLMETPGEGTEVIDLCRDLIKGDLTWGRLQKTLKGMPEVQAESIRIIVVNYLNACLMGSKNDKDTMRLLDIQECFSKPCNPTDKLAPVLIAFGRYIYG